jgi:peroxiredoxin
MAELATIRLHPGDVAPPFSLPGVDGKTWSLADFKDSPFLVVTFWCNHCPYVQAWEGRTIALQKEFESKGVRFVLINSNDDRSYPEDRFERMSARAKEKGYPFPYLRDDSQQVARAYGALVTPHPMLFGPDRRLLFQGRIDDNHSEPDRVKHHFLRETLEAATAGRPIPVAELPVQGCSVKWRT